MAVLDTFGGEGGAYACERPTPPRPRNDPTVCPDGIPNDDGKTLTIKVVTDEAAVDTGQCRTFLIACVEPNGMEDKPIPDQTLYIQETPSITLADGGQVAGVWTNDPREHRQPNDEGKVQIYLPGIMKHEFGHPFGLVDLGNLRYVDNPDQYVDYLMHATPAKLDKAITEVPNLDIRYLGENHKDR